MIQLAHDLVLASASPRRKDILDMMELDFEVVPSLYEEPRHSEHLTEPETFAQEIAFGKGEEVFDRFEQQKMVLSADTIGVLEDVVLEKPDDREDAKRMLTMMSGKTHVVITAVCLFIPDQEPQQELVTTSVTFRELDEQEIDDYLDQEEYLDKAAAYAIQGKAAVFVESIEGEYLNIVGLPLTTVWKMLKRSLQ